MLQFLQPSLSGKISFLLKMDKLKLSQIKMPKSFALIPFLKEVREELTKVTWPSKDETVRLTSIVVGVSLIVGAYIAGLDYFFTELVGLIIKR